MPRILRILIWIVIAALGATALATVALHRGEQINAMWLVVAAVCTLCDRLPFLQQVHRGESADPGCASGHACRAIRQWPRFCSHQQVGSLRTSFRRYRRSRAAGRPGAGRAIWLSSRNSLDTRGGCLRRMCAGLRDSAVFHPAGRQIARPKWRAKKLAVWEDW